MLAHGRWFSPGSPASSTTKTGRHDIAEILLKVALNIKNQIKCPNNVVSLFSFEYNTCFFIKKECRAIWHFDTLLKEDDINLRKKQISLQKTYLFP